MDDENELFHLGELWLTPNYRPLPFVVRWARGAELRDASGTTMIDLVAGYGVHNAGQNHDRILAVRRQAIDELWPTLTSRALSNEWIGPWARDICELTGFDRVLPMVTGAEGIETAIKIARRWAYRVKQVPPNQAMIFGAMHNFHGRTPSAVALSTDPHYRANFGPYVPGFNTVPYGNIEALETAILQNADCVCAIILEPAQAEGGMNFPGAEYLRAVRALADKYGILVIYDEIQCGFGRTGKNFCFQHAGPKPDLLVLGKYLGGGLPLSCVLGSNQIMELMDPGSHGSTFGGWPLACATSRMAMQIMRDEALANRAQTTGRVLSDFITKLATQSDWVEGPTGVGMLLGIKLREGAPPFPEIQRRLMDHGLLTNDAHGVVRVTPALNIDDNMTERIIRGLSGALTPD